MQEWIDGKEEYREEKEAPNEGGAGVLQFLGIRKTIQEEVEQRHKKYRPERVLSHVGD